MLVVVNLDPVNMQHGCIELPLDAWNVLPTQTIEALDLLSDESYSLARRAELRPPRSADAGRAHPAAALVNR